MVMLMIMMMVVVAVSNMVAPVCLSEPGSPGIGGRFAVAAEPRQGPGGAADQGHRAGGRGREGAAGAAGGASTNKTGSINMMLPQCPSSGDSMRHMPRSFCVPSGSTVMSENYLAESQEEARALRLRSAVDAEEEYWEHGRALPAKPPQRFDMDLCRASIATWRAGQLSLSPYARVDCQQHDTEIEVYQHGTDRDIASEAAAALRYGPLQGLHCHLAGRSVVVVTLSSSLSCQKHMIEVPR
jgi:hypothetical protein